MEKEKEKALVLSGGEHSSGGFKPRVQGGGCCEREVCQTRCATAGSNYRRGCAAKGRASLREAVSAGVAGEVMAMVGGILNREGKAEEEEEGRLKATGRGRKKEEEGEGRGKGKEKRKKKRRWAGTLKQKEKKKRRRRLEAVGWAG